MCNNVQDAYHHVHSGNSRPTTIIWQSRDCVHNVHVYTLEKNNSHHQKTMSLEINSNWWDRKECSPECSTLEGYAEHFVPKIISYAAATKYYCPYTKKEALVLPSNTRLGIRNPES